MGHRQTFQFSFQYSRRHFFFVRHPHRRPSFSLLASVINFPDSFWIEESRRSSLARPARSVTRSTAKVMVQVASRPNRSFSGRVIPLIASPFLLSHLGH